MSITVEVISKETIKPSTPTPTQLKNHSLSLIDQYIVPCFIPIILFYPTAPAVNDDTGNNQHGDNSISLLKRSLSETLVHFYPLAGRIKNNIVVDCSDQGIKFIQVKVSGSMSEFLKKPDEQLCKILPSEDVCMNSLREGQMIVQVNTFDCRSTAISLCVLHKVADVASMATFIRFWAQNTIAVSSTTPISSPINVTSKLHPTFDAASLFPPTEQLVSLSTELDSNHSEESNSVSKIISKKFIFDGKTINSVREKISESMADKYKCRRPSRVEIVSALIWKSFVKLATPGSSSVMVKHSVNLRRRIDPPLPDVSFGNIVEFTKLVVGAASKERTTTQESSSSKLHEELNEFVCQFRESINKMMNKGDHDFDMLQSGENEERLLYMSSWCNYGCYDIDFGRGKPIWVTTVGQLTPMLAYPDLFFMNDTRCGEGIEVWGNLVEEDMVNFQHNLSELLDKI
ncbi:hypothetical protein MKX01_042823 [Papaver californicum]|nr:hypothetical protein MKX01_042823 [Papaver californicum]